jgi:protein-disulfide isomerase
MAPAPGRVRIAYFTDYFCPYCRVLDALLADVAATDARIAITRHEVPLLGPSSVEAARASLSADALGAGAAVRARMIATPFRPTDGYLRRTAADAGIDADRLLAGMDAPDVTRRMETSEAVFRRFGFAGTPGLVVGTTAVNGAVDAATLRRLVDLEAETPPAC